MNDIIFFFRDLRLDAGAIWMEGETIRLSTSKKLQNAETKDFITGNKNQIISILKENKIFSKERFLNVLIFKDTISSVFPLSPAQERLWFIEQYEQGSSAYHIPLIYELEDNTDIEGMKYAIGQVVSRHEVLRTTIEQGDNREYGVQVVHDGPPVFEERILTHLNDFESLVEEDINRPFDLSTEYPVRVKFYYIRSGTAGLDDQINKTLLLINTHHIASDGWSLEIFEKELYGYYEAYINNDKDFSLPPLEIQYKDYAVWQRTFLTGDVLEKQAAYWKDKLAGYHTLELPTDYTRPAEIDYRGAAQEFTISRETSQKLRAIARQHGVTLFSTLLSSINIFFGKYTGQDDIVVGSVVANRQYRQTEGLIGFFVNTQVNRTLLSNTQSFEELVQQVHQEQILAQLNQDLPFEKLVQELGIERDPSRHPVFQVMVDLQSHGSREEDTDLQGYSRRGEDADQQKVYLTPFQLEDHYNVEKFDLSINIIDGHEEEKLAGQISYATALFSHSAIERFTERYIHLLGLLAAQPDQPYSQLSLLNPEEYHQVVHEWNATNKDYPEGKTICQVFQEQVGKTPGSPALVYEGLQLTYKELNEKSNRLARHIREQYHQRTNKILAPGTFIALYLDRSLEMVVALLAVLKAGGAYVPIDTSYPQERIDYLLDDTRAALVLSRETPDETTDARLPDGKLIFVNLSEALYQSGDASNLPQHSRPDDLAYLIYTSGSTGQAKGVQVEHAPVVNMALDRVAEYKMATGENSLQVASLCFDASVEQIFVALFSGATLTMIKKEVLFDADQCVLFLNENRITHLDTVPSFLETLDFSKLKHLKRIASGGEACTVELVNRITPYIEFYNEYGPTEATVISTSYKIEKNTEVLKQVPIGRPISNTKIFILDKHLGIVPPGITGEIYIGGGCLARGYLNSDQLTAEKFISNPYGAGRLYKTGDLGRWLKDGQIEYAGRNDDQVKIRGFRIELGEINQALSCIAGIKQSYVVVKERKTGSGNNKFLAAYYELDKNVATHTPADIREQLSLQLPEYMVPAAFMELDEFPTMLSGKLDKQALPDPGVSEADQFTSPETELEIKLCRIYAEVLGLASDQVSTHENFFNMGGSSILSIRLKAKLKQLKEFKHIGVADLFKYNSVGKLVRSLRNGVRPEYMVQENRAQDDHHEIAIIGMSGAFSGAEDVEALWQLIANQQEGTRFLDRAACEELGLEKTVLNDPGFVPVFNTLKGIELFEPLFWEMSPNEARQLDPQIRKFIERCWMALETSGYARLRREAHIGVFAGSGSGSYFNDHVMNGEMAGQINMWEAAASNGKDALATKAAYHLDLSGPAISINTACSTGLVCVVEACKNLQLGTCNMALAGGVSLAMPYEAGYFYEEGMILSKDGHCRVFDSEATGTIPGSGVGVVLLKRLDDAVKDKDDILGVIKGYASNNDGARKTAYTAPSLIGQAECIIHAQKMAGISADQLDYIECHGTGTRLGDPIEVQALKEAFQSNPAARENATKSKTVLGAIKANIGHTDSAAGTAGLIKVVAMLQHGTLPGQANYEKANPELQLDQTRFEIIKENRAWPANPGQPRLAGVSSFGIGGTNAHVIVGDYTGALPDMEKTGDPEASLPYIIPLSAKSRQSLEHYKQALAAYLTGNTNKQQTFHIRDVAYTLQERREQFSFRSAYRAGSIDELVSKMSLDPSYTQTTEGENKIVLMFPGQGAQYPDMAKALYENEPFFKDSVDQCIQLANRHLPVDLYELLYPGDTASPYDINAIEWTPVSLFTIEYSLAKFLEHLGIYADAYIGHSSGEYVAAALAGVFSLEDAIKVLIARGRLMQLMPAGGMLAVNAGEEALRTIVKEFHCDIAVINTPEDVVVSGAAGAIDQLFTALEKLAIPVIKINAAVAGHSRLMEEASRQFERAFDGIRLHKPTKSFAANLTGAIAGEEVTKASYWCRQLRHTVQFAKGIDALSRRHNHQISFIETGTGKGLGYFVNKYRKANNYPSIQAIQLLPSTKEIKATDTYTFQPIECAADIKATLWMSGVIKGPNEAGLLNRSKRLTDLPAYQFNHQKCWIDRKETGIADDGLNLLPETQWLSAPVWSAVSNLNKNSTDGHRVFNNAIIFIRKDQLNLFDFASFTQSHQLIILVPGIAAIDIPGPARPIRLDPCNEQHFEKLAACITAGQLAFETIIHAASINNVSDLEAALGYGFYSLFLIREHLLNTAGLENLLVLTNGLAQITNADMIRPSNGAMVGAIRNINHEYRQIDARIIDTGEATNTIAAGLSQIWSNNGYQKSETLLAIRFGKIWKEEFEQIAHSFPEEPVIKEGDVILVTGGLGGVGLAVTRGIAARHNVTFILVSRKNIYDDPDPSATDKEKIQIIEAVRARGSAVDILCADISSQATVHALLNTVKQRHGHITGIVHTAGASPLEIDDCSFENVKEAFKGKVYGISNITNALDMAPVRFVASTSSLASIMGDVNRIEYCASNSYLDYLAVDKQTFRDTKIISVNWNGWLNEGSTIEEVFGGETSQVLYNIMLLNAATFEYNADLFYRLISQNTYPQVIVSKFDIRKLKDSLFKQEKPQLPDREIAVLDESYTETEYQMALIFADVLGIEQISLQDDFFKLGGNSILAIQLSHRLTTALGYDVKVADVFKYKTISQLLLHGNNQAQTDIPRTAAVRSVLSFAQERLWFIEQYEQGSHAYHIPMIYELDAATDKEGMKYAIRQIVSRHEVLRTTIEQGGNNEQGIQLVHDGSLSFEEVLVTTDKNLDSLLEEDINRPFDLSAEYPIRVTFYQLETGLAEPDGQPAKTVLLINTHHIASDGWSLEIFERELYAYYEAYINNITDFSLPPLEIQYKDYAIWQREYLTGEIIENQLAYWKNKLAGFQTLELPTDYTRPAALDYEGASVAFTLNPETSQKLRVLAQQYGVTLYSVLLSSVNVLLGKYTGQDDIVMGSVIANRQYRQTESLIGFFVNTQVNRTLLNTTQNFEELVRQVHLEQVQAQINQDLPFEKLVEELGIERDPSRHPVFQVMFGLQSSGRQDEGNHQQKEYLIPYQAGDVYEVAKFDLSITFMDSQQELSGLFGFATALFDSAGIERLVQYYNHLLEHLAALPEQPYSQHSLLSPEEYERIVYDWNDTDDDYPKDKTIYRLFQEQVEKTPENIALVYKGQQVTYQQLNEKSNQLARHIRKQYLQKTKRELNPDTLIALGLERSLELVIGKLAILKAGGAYVPIDMNYPQERIDYLLRDTKAELILSQRTLGDGIHAQLPPDTVIYIGLAEELYKVEDSSNLPPHSSATDLAYVIYTSGTTGRPKGVMVEQKSVVSLVCNDFIRLSAGDVFAFLSSPLFDATTFEIWTPLLQGNTLIIPADLKNLISDVDSFKKFLATNNVSVLWLTKTLFESLFHLNNGVFEKLNYLIIGGEALDKHVVTQLTSSPAKPIHFLNGYGPTESTTFTCIYDLYSKITAANVPIGTPIKNRNTYVLYPDLTPVPVGTTGELYIGGAGLSRGYLNNTKLTAERFIENLFATESDKVNGYTRLYKTGDLVRWLADGNMEYIGRNDDQVKIRGFRIELGEIEHALSRIPGIRQSCVVAKERKTESGITKYLTGYYVLESKAESLTQTEIHDRLALALPEYMVPGALLAIESFPITINGKLDKRALPDPDFTSAGEAYVAPTGEIETALCKVWQEVLGLERVGSADNFFRIGGNSILAIRVSHQMSKAVSREVKVADIFKYKTISQLVIHGLGQLQVIIPQTDSSQAPLSFAQERLWFIEQYEQGTNAYHIPEVFELDNDTDIAGIQYALQQIVSRHEVLRSTIEEGATGRHGIQRVHKEPLYFEQVTLTDKEDVGRLIKEDINRPFDLRIEYPMRVKLYTISPEETPAEPRLNRNVLLINTHHIAGDAWSSEIFQNELSAYYEAYVNNNTGFNLPPLEIQYKDYAAWQREYFTEGVLEKQLNYWKRKLAGYQNLELPTDYARPANVDYRGSGIAFTISREVSQKIRYLVRYHEVTLNSVMLSSINIMLGKYTGQEDIVTGSVIANRHHRQTESLIGFFVNTQANRTLLNRSQSFADLIKQVHQDQVQAQLYQDLPFEKLVEEMGVERDSSRHPVFQVMFMVNSFASQYKEDPDEQKGYLLPFQAEDVYEVEKFDLSIQIEDNRQEITGVISYATALFRKQTIEQFINHYTLLLNRLAQSPEQPYSQHSLLSPEEYQQIVYGWNDTGCDYPKDKTIGQAFMEQAEKTPDNIALVYEGQQLTYQQLNQKSNQLARHIRQQYFQRTHQPLAPDTLIALHLHRSLEVVLSILAVLKAGGAYVPIDIHHPGERIDYILEDTKAELILCQKTPVEVLPAHLPLGKVVFIGLEEELYKVEDGSNLPQHSQATDLAYVIYTSGTTGRPNGVMVEQAGVINLVENLLHQYRIGPLERVLLFANYVFDASVEQMYLALLSGGALYVMQSEAASDSTVFEDYIAENGITHLHATPSFLSSVDPSGLRSVKRVVFGAEHLTQQLFEQYRAVIPVVINEYGPTEATITALVSINSHLLNRATIQHTKAYVLDTDHNPVPVGVTGELYLCGAGLARGYLNNPALTALRFIDNPFSTHEELSNGYTRLYKTGDLVRWLADGNMEYIGRTDEQVKIRGFRIELGEIEHALSQIAGIRQSCVVARERKTESGITKYLTCYYVLESTEEALSPAAVEEKLSLVLPGYMVPGALVALEAFPLTVNGKLDKRALPVADFTSVAAQYAPPANETEATFCGIWQEVLGLEQVGINDDFFKTGGDSVLSIQASSRIRQAGFNCQVKEIFEYRTIARLVRHLSHKSSSPATLSEQGTLTGEAGLLPVQQWFLEKVDKGALAYHHHWNQSFLVRVPALSTEKLAGVIEKLVVYHDVLRMRYIREQKHQQADGQRTGHWKQVYQPTAKLPLLKVLDVSKHSEAEVHHLLTEWQSGFNIEQGPLWQSGYLYGYEDGSARIYIALHHLVTDAVSWGVLIDDIKTLYEGGALPPKGSSYRQWVESVKRYADQHQAERSYWEEQLNAVAAYHAQFDEQEPWEEVFELNSVLTRSLLQEASEAYHTQINDLLLTALAYGLREINGHNIQGITLEGHGREEIDASIDHSRTVGWFTTLFPVKLVLRENLGESIRSVKEGLRNIPNKGIGFGMFATEAVNGFTQQSLPPASFNYLGQFEMQEGEWQVVGESSGESIHAANSDPNLININGMVGNGKIGFSIATRLGKAATNILCNGFRSALTKVIQHCKKKLERKESSYTPSDFEFVRISQLLLDRLQTTAQANRNEIAQIYAATSLQQGFIYHALSQPGDDAYRVQVLFDYHLSIDTGNFIKAWECCIRQYPILRTAFNWEEEIIQVVYSQGQLEYAVHDVSHLVTRQQRDAAIEEIRTEDRKRSFDLTRPTLLRLHIIRQSAEYYTVLRTEHHSISDGWSGQILFDSVEYYYQEFSKNKNPYVNEDTAYLQTQEYISKHKDTVAKYWEAVLSQVENANDINALLSIPIDTGNYKQVEKSATCTLELKGGTYDAIKSFSQREGITLNVLVQFAWHMMLQVYSNSLQSIVGTTVSGRDLPVEGIEESVGLYINTLPLIINWDNDNTLLDQLHQIQQKITELNTNSFAELATLQKGGERIFHTLFIYENYPVPKAGNDIPEVNSDSAGAEISFRNAVEKVDYPLSVIAYEYDKTLTIRLEYDSNYLSEKKARQHIEVVEYIVCQVIKNPGQPHRQLILLRDEEFEKVIYQWNDTGKNYPKDKTVCGLFQEQVEKMPDRVALVFEDQALTYKELNENANRLARYIRKQYFRQTGKELHPGATVALYLDKSTEMVIGLLAVLKAGGAYIPLDISYPQERIDYLLGDSGAKIILSQKHLSQGNAGKLPPDKVIYIGLAEEGYDEEDASDLPQHSNATDLAYVIYTSGTTGFPKGVKIAHASLTNLIFEQKNLLEIDQGSKMLQYASLIFDASVWEIFSALSHGAQLAIVPPRIRKDAHLLCNFLANAEITIALLPPGLLGIMPYAPLPKLQTLLVGGDVCSSETMHRWAKGRKLINAYGPTEGTVITTMHTYEAGDKHTIIGKPLANISIYVLNGNSTPVPVGIAGELYIGGAGLALGYLNKKELTEQHFMANMFATEAERQNGEGRLYRTGDLVRWRPDGNLEIIGRNDDQVKIRGFRIALGEIEHALSEIAGVQQSCVIVKERKTGLENTRYLVAYYVSDNSSGTTATPAGIAERLSHVLPEYMVPGAYMELASLPFTTNGKIDKSALPDPDLRSWAEEYTAPVTETEGLICTIWQKVLGLDRVGTRDDFFRIGGNSILAIQVSHRMSKVLACDVQVTDVFKFKTIRMLLDNISVRQVNPDNVEWDVLVQPYHDHSIQNNNGREDMIFIHPGHGGAEVYQSLAEILSSAYNCIGIDNYNIHHKEKINSLNELAHFYLSVYKEKYALGKSVNLLGWSLGGHIALEMAAILELKGLKNINVFLLDTLLNGNAVPAESKPKRNRHFTTKNGFNTKHKGSYFKKVAAAFETEMALAHSSISSYLQHTRVVLFKAMQTGNRLHNNQNGLKAPNQQPKKYQANNIDLVTGNLLVIELDCDHENILKTNSTTVGNYILVKNIDRL